MITRHIGQSAFNEPSSAAAAVFTGDNFQKDNASTAVIAKADRHAVWLGILRRLKATISQIIGSSAKRNFTNIITKNSSLIRRDRTKCFS